MNEVINVKIINSSIKINEKEYFNYSLYADAILDLEKNLNYISDNLVENTKFNLKELNLDSEEFKKVFYNSYLYYLLNWSGSNYHKKLHYLSWHLTFKFLQNLNNENSNNDKYIFYLDYSNGNIDYIYDLIKKYFPSSKIISNKNKIKTSIFNLFYKHSLFKLFLLRTYFINNSTFSSNYIFFSNYERYYKNENYFSNEFFKNEKVKSYLKNISKRKIVYTKYSVRNIFSYIKEVRKNPNKGLFIENLLNLNLGVKLLFKKKAKANYDGFEDEVQKYLLQNYKLFLNSEFKFFLWHYISMKKYLLNINQNITLISDNETNFMFYFCNMVQKLNNLKNIKTISFTHDTITKIMSKLPISKSNNIYPDRKLVWNIESKKILMENYNLQNNKIEVFEDPRFFYWNKFKKIKKTILILSTLEINYYLDLINLGKNPLFRNLIKNGFKIYFKPHPIEIGDRNKINLINELKKNNKINYIEDLNFIPEYTIGNVSIMLYELFFNGSIPLFYSIENIFNLEKKYFVEHSMKDLNESFSFILRKFKK